MTLTLSRLGDIFWGRPMQKKIRVITALIKCDENVEQIQGDTQQESSDKELGDRTTGAHHTVQTSEGSIKRHPELCFHFHKEETTRDVQGALRGSDTPQGRSPERRQTRWGTKEMRQTSAGEGMVSFMLSETPQQQPLGRGGLPARS